jgi:hypothetical protein
MEHTLVVPPVYEAQLFGKGYEAAQIGVRKVWLLKNLQRSISCSYKTSDGVATMSFAQLVDFVVSKQQK